MKVDAVRLGQYLYDKGFGEDPDHAWFKLFEALECDDPDEMIKIYKLFEQKGIK